MTTKICTWGNGQGLRLAKDILRLAHLNTGDQVDIEVHDGAIIIRPHDIDELNIHRLAAEMPADYAPREEWDNPVGNELW